MDCVVEMNDWEEKDYVVIEIVNWEDDHYKGLVELGKRMADSGAYVHWTTVADYITCALFDEEWSWDYLNVVCGHSLWEDEFPTASGLILYRPAEDIWSWENMELLDECDGELDPYYLYYCLHLSTNMDVRRYYDGECTDVDMWSDDTSYELSYGTDVDISYDPDQDCDSGDF